MRISTFHIYKNVYNYQRLSLSYKRYVRGRGGREQVAIFRLLEIAYVQEGPGELASQYDNFSLCKAFCFVSP